MSYAEMGGDELIAAASAEMQLSPVVAGSIVLQLDYQDAFKLLATLQLALRHPANTGPTAQLARLIARELEAALTLGPATEELIRRGWDPAHDVERAPVLGADGRPVAPTEG